MMKRKKGGGWNVIWTNTVFILVHVLGQGRLVSLGECDAASVVRPARPGFGAIPESPFWGDQRDSRAPRELPCFGDRTGPELPDQSESVLFLGALASPKSWRPRGEGTRRVGWPHGGAVSPEATSKAAPAIRVHFPQLRAFPVLSASPPAPPPAPAWPTGSRGPEVCSHFPQERA